MSRRLALLCCSLLLLACATPQHVQRPRPSATPTAAGDPAAVSAADSAIEHDASLRQRRHDRMYGWIEQSLPPDHRLVVFYGNPYSSVLGPIAGHSDADLLAMLHSQADAYTQLDSQHPASLALDYVTPVAQPDPTQDGGYRFRMPDDSIQHYLSLALQNHVLFMFDIQPGHSPVSSEVDALWPYIQQPGVGIALDPEFDMTNLGGVPGQRIGTMYASEINAVQDRLSQVVEATGQPPKILVVHQFTDELPDRDQIKTDPGVILILCIDGVGSPDLKRGTYGRYANPPVGLPGFKLFYQSDIPLMSPQDVLALNPQPLLVMYQ